MKIKYHHSFTLTAIPPVKNYFATPAMQLNITSNPLGANPTPHSLIHSNDQSAAFVSLWIYTLFKSQSSLQPTDAIGCSMRGVNRGRKQPQCMLGNNIHTCYTWWGKKRSFNQLSVNTLVSM